VVPAQLSKTYLVGSQTIGSGHRRKPRDAVDLLQCSIRVDCPDSNGPCVRVLGVHETTICADCDIYIVTAGGISPHNSAPDRRQAAILGHIEAGNSIGTRIGRIYKLAIWRNGQPAVSRALGRNGRTDRTNGCVAVDAER
jgi:hypothetical protein